VKQNPTRFLNADLEIFSESPLQPLIDEIGERAFLLHGGPFSEEFPYMASYEIDHDPESKTPDALILAFCDLISSFSPESRLLWDGARKRVIDLGYEVPPGCERIQDSIPSIALLTMAGLRIDLAWTIYPRDEQRSC
jgi:hypothetical protein